MEKYVAYYRISKENKEGKYLGMDAQQQIVEHYYPVLERSFTEVKSGKNITEREQLKKAIEYCLKNNCILIVAKLDRLSRSVDDARLVLKLLKGNIRFCDIPGIPDKFTITMYAAFAERERELIALRTSQALKQKVKSDGKHWLNSNNRSKGITEGEFLHKAREAHKEKASNKPENKIAADIICTELSKGKTLQQVVEHLINLGCKTSTGTTNWSITQVVRIRNRYCNK